jgi:hypothetical protein
MGQGWCGKFLHHGLKESGGANDTQEAFLI